MLRRLGKLSLDIAWAAVILLLPITSLPLLSRLAGNTMVAPASLIPLAWLILFWFIIFAVKKGSIAREGIPFLFFISVTVITGALAYFWNTPTFKGSTVFHEETSAFLTLLIGAAFYLVTTSWLSKSESKLVLTFKFVNISGSIMLLWAVVQASIIFLNKSRYPAILMEFQRLVSTRDLFVGRVTSFAFEPSWLAQQLNLLYLPFWLSATLSGWSAFRFRLGKISLENILLVVGIVILFISSRVGTLSFLLVLAFLGVYFNIYLAKRLQTWVMDRFVNFKAVSKRIIRAAFPVILFVAFIGIYFSGAVALIYVLSHVDLRLARIFQVASLAQLKQLTSNVYALFNYLAFAERFVYWVAGWHIFNAHPIFGVGLGNAGFYFQQALPAYSWSLPEVMDTFYRYSAVPNIKSLWVRLLAETGIVGFSSFVTWCYVMFRSAWSMRFDKAVLFKLIGIFGLFVLIAFTLEGFSTDTFALPYLWISLGIVSAARTLLPNLSQKK